LNTKLPIITVLMPVYNGATYLNDAIDSILNQTFSDFQFLIIDDGSTDDSVKIIKSYDDYRIRVVKNKNNLGQSATLNKGLELARGKYIARMDQDDISMPERLKKQFEFMENKSDIDVCGSWIQLMGKYDGIVELETDSERIKINLLTNQNLAHPAVMIRKSTLVKYELSYNPTFTIGNDYDLWVRMFDYCSFANLPEPLLKFRMHDNQYSKILWEQNEVETNRILTNLLKKIGIHPDDSDLIIHKKLFTGYGIGSLLTGEVFKYLMRLRKSNLRKNIYGPAIFNEFLKKKWRRFMLNNNNKLLYWASVLLFFRPINFLQFIENHFLHPKKHDNA
jgi:glycosyltransferase involved in cell wall biosynthesis